jgi:Arc/MetJ-type ribon-helix-helix transcriptional regulator
MSERNQLKKQPKKVKCFRSVSLNDELVERVEHLIHSLGTYRTIAEFVSEAVRLRLEALEKHQRTEGENE